MDLKTTQLKDTYGNLLTIGTTAGSPTSGILQNGDGDNVIELAIRVDTTTASTITDDLVSVADEKDMAQNNGGGIKFGGVFTTGGSPNADMAFIKASKSNATSGNYSYDMVLGTRTNGQTPLERMRIHDNGDISFRDGSANEAFYWDASTARLGIGTGSTVDDKFHIVGTSTKIQELGQTGITMKFNHGNNASVNSDINIANIKSFVSSGSSGSEGGGLTFETKPTAGSATERMRIDSNGNVGIGTTTPADNLQVNGGVTFGGDTTLAHRCRIYESFGLNIDSGSGTGRPIIFRTDDTEAMRIDSSGRQLLSSALSYNFIGSNTSDGTDNERLFLSGGGDASSGRGAVIGLYGNEYSGSTGILALQAGTESGYIQFMTGSTTTERARITDDGLTFNGDTATANALDDYEEGTFTPTLKGASTEGTFTYSAQSGSYTKIGRQVTVNINLTVSGITVSPSGTAIIESLPFTSSAGYYAQGAGFMDNLGSDNRQTSFQINPNSVRIVLVKDTGTTTGHGGLDISEFSGNEAIRLTATYFV